MSIASHTALEPHPAEVPEDVLIAARIRDLATAAGFEVQLHPGLSLLKRETGETLYYSCLRFVPPLRWALPCILDYEFRKP